MKSIKVESSKNTRKKKWYQRVNVMEMFKLVVELVTSAAPEL